MEPTQPVVAKPKKPSKGYVPKARANTAVKEAPEELKTKYEAVPEDKLTAMKEARAVLPAATADKSAAAPAPSLAKPITTATAKPTEAPKKTKVDKTKSEAAPKKYLPKAPPPVAAAASDVKTREDRFKAAVEERYPYPDPADYKHGEESKRFIEKSTIAEGKRIELTEKKDAEPPLATYEKAQKDYEEKGHYALDTQIFIPVTRRAFYPFIRETYADIFGLEPKTGETKVDKEACEKLMKAGQQSVEAFLYQRFVKEYIRQASPYRGILVYHGLGSGKTCTSIAAAEALYGVANKKIIVMTPFSLRANFLRELTFCGFRHYSLNNHWVKYPLLVRKLIKDESGRLIQSTGVKKHVELYAKSVLSLSDSFVERLIANKTPLWIPDFTLPPNYNDTATITQADRDQIRAQINETINNRIQFINYNGVGKKQLRAWACEAKKTGKTIFDDAVIVIDEIHNLIRLMQGAIIPFLQDRPGQTRRRKIKAEPIMPGRWMPNLCPPEEEPEENVNLEKEQEEAAETDNAVEMEGATAAKAKAKLESTPAEYPNYNRAFLFYRLLTGAKNSKIIGLSGTPITNFPEEVAILANVLGGYLDSFEFSVSGLASTRIPELKALLDKDPRTDLVQIIQKDKGLGVLCTIFQEGYVKVLDETGKFQGVKHDPSAQEPIDTIYERLKTEASSKGITFSAPSYKSYPRLPPDGDEFRPYFVDTATSEIKNETLLQKRITGLISYYKGSKEEFMPRVVEDEVVQCEMSEYMLSKYVEARQAEMKKEEGKKGEPDDIYGIVEMFAKSRNPSSYRFRSRAICNFVFPDGITRPFPDSIGKIEQEVKDIEDLDLAERQTEGLQEATEEERAALEASIAKDKAAQEEQEEEDTKSRAELEEPEAEEAAPAAPAAPSLAEAAADAAESVAEAVQEAVTGVTKQEAKTYEDLLKEAMAKLSENKDKYLTLNGETQEQRLSYYSPKLDKIIRKIEESPGPALVYSQFVTVEGLGVLGISLEANGYDEIYVGQSRTGHMYLPEKTVASIMKGPGVKRYITFSGKGTREQRAAALAIFNGNFSVLPKDIQNVFQDYDKTVTDPTKTYQALANRHGEICKVIGISGAGAEGISLKCVRQVHIMEPFWNMVRLDQVKGRAIRICSHAELPDDERDVSIYTYVAYFTEAQIKPSAVEAAGPKVDFTLLQRDKNETSDQKVFNVADKKDKINEGLLKVMKSAAIDCLMNLPDNEESDPDKQYSCFTTAETDASKPMFLPDIAKDKAETDTNRVEKQTATAVALGKETPVEVSARETARLIRPKDTVERDTVKLIDRAGNEVEYSIDLKDAKTRTYYFFALKDLLQEKALGEMTKDPLRAGYTGIVVYKTPLKIR